MVSGPASGTVARSFEEEEEEEDDDEIAVLPTLTGRSSDAGTLYG